MVESKRDKYYLVVKNVFIFSCLYSTMMIRNQGVLVKLLGIWIFMKTIFLFLISVCFLSNTGGIIHVVILIGLTSIYMLT